MTLALLSLILAFWFAIQVTALSIFERFIPISSLFIGASCNFLGWKKTVPIRVILSCVSFLDGAPTLFLAMVNPTAFLVTWVTVISTHLAFVYLAYRFTRRWFAA